MAVTEVLRGVGGWSLLLRPNLPSKTWEALKYFGHVVIHSGHQNPKIAKDSLLKDSRYTGVLRRKEAGEGFSISGPGMAMWLGDEEGKGDVFEALKTYTNSTFQATITNLLPPGGSILAGTIFNLASNFTGTFQYVTPRQAIDYVAQTLNAEWRVNHNGTLDAGLESDLFVVNPKCAVLRKDSGLDFKLRGLPGEMKTEQDVDDFTTRVVLLASNAEGTSSSGSANIAPAENPYKDLHGNSIKRTRLIEESSTDPNNATARANLQLNRFKGTRDAITLSTSDHDVKGSAAVGDYLWVWDEELGLVGPNEVRFRGNILKPLKLRLTEMTWPVVRGMGVYFRDWAGVWYDLTDYVEWEQGDTSLVVGGYNRSLTGGGDGAATSPGSPPNTSVPAAPTWVTPFTQSVYLSPITGETRAQVELTWLKPNNTDATTITDGSHYEVRYRTATTPLFPVTWSQLSGKTWAQLQSSGAKWENPLVYTAVEWSYLFIPFDQLKTMLVDLVPSMPYEAQIRAVDTASPSNYGAWSTLTSWQTSRDTIAPKRPAPPTVAASTLAIQITHTLGVSTGGTYNLDLDTHHLEVHGSNAAGFEPGPTTLLGKVSVRYGMITGQIPVVASFPIDSLTAVYFKVIAVDTSGNKSGPSSAVSSTALLVDDAHITNLTVSKLTAGTMTANVILGGYIATGLSGSRVIMHDTGIEGFNFSGVRIFDLSTVTGNLSMQGKLVTGTASTRMEFNPDTGWPRIDMYPSSSTNHVTMAAMTGADPRGNSSPGMLLQSENSSRNVIGGYLVFAPNGVFLGSNYGTASTHGYYWIDDQGIHNLRGRWLLNNFDAYSALIVGQTGIVGVNNVGIAINYPLTMISAMIVLPVGHITGEESGYYNWACSVWPGTSTSTGFTSVFVREAKFDNYGAGPARSGRMNYWAFRI